LGGRILIPGDPPTTQKKHKNVGKLKRRSVVYALRPFFTRRGMVLLQNSGETKGALTGLRGMSACQGGLGLIGQEVLFYPTSWSQRLGGGFEEL